MVDTPDHTASAASTENGDAGSSGGGQSGRGRPAPTRSAIFETLSSPRRRCVLHYLKRNDGTATVGEMARTLAAWEADIPPEAVDSRARKRVYTSLYQVHLPKMDGEGFLEYDRRGGFVTLTDRAETLDVQLEVVDGNDIPWSEFYLGLSSLFAVVAVLSVLAVPPLTAVSAGLWSVGFAVLFLTASAVHVVRTRTSSIWQGERPAEMEYTASTGVPADD
jgi:hypothetical protein